MSATVIEGEAEEVPSAPVYTPPPPTPPTPPPRVDPVTGLPMQAAPPPAPMVMPPEVEAGIRRASQEAAARGGQLRITRRVPETGEWMIVIERAGGGFSVLGWAGDGPTNEIGSPVSTMQEAHDAVETLATGAPPSRDEPPPPKTLFSDDPEARLAWAKERAKEKIDGDAEKCRLKFITGGAGQAMEYLASEQEAEQILSMGSGFIAPDNPMLFPFLRAEAQARGTTIYEAAEATAQAAAQWRHVGGAIKALRLSGKAAVDAAETEEAVWAASNITWPAPA